MSCLQHVLASSSIVPTPAATQVVSSLHDNQQPLSMGSVKPLVQPGIPESSLQGSPAREEGEVPESELDPNTRRRLLILQHGQDTRDHVPNDSVLPARVPLQVSLNPPIQSHGGWFPVEEEMSPRKLNRAPKDFAFEPEAVRYDKNRPFFPRVDNFSRPERPIHDNQRLPKEVFICRYICIYLKSRIIYFKVDTRVLFPDISRGWAIAAKTCSIKLPSSARYL